MRVQFSSHEMARSAVPAPSAPPVNPDPAGLTPASYESALSELDRLVQQMEGGQLPLDQLLSAYRRGAELLAYCRSRLQSVEEQVQLLDDGQLKPWGAT